MKLQKEMKLVDPEKLDSAEGFPSRDGFGHGLVTLGKRNKNIVELCCDLTDSTRAGWFKEKFPERFIEAGIAEQNMMGVAAGLAMVGKVPFVSSYAAFNPGRNWDQLRVSVCYQNMNVKIEGAHAGISVGPDGATHQALEDVASTRCLPNLTVIVPCDALEAERATVAAGIMKGPVYLRFGREKVPNVTTKSTPFKIGKAYIYKDGKDVAIVANGIMVYEALLAARELEKKGVSAMVVNCPTVKPLDKDTLVAVAKKTKAIVCAEEHQVHGGLGSAVAELLSQHYPVPIKYVAVMDRFGESGQPQELLKAFGLKHTDIMKAVTAVLKMKK